MDRASQPSPRDAVFHDAPCSKACNPAMKTIHWTRVDMTCAPSVPFHQREITVMLYAATINSRESTQERDSKPCVISQKKIDSVHIEFIRLAQDCDTLIFHGQKSKFKLIISLKHSSVGSTCLADCTRSVAPDEVSRYTSRISHAYARLHRIAAESNRAYHRVGPDNRWTMRYLRGANNSIFQTLCGTSLPGGVITYALRACPVRIDASYWNYWLWLTLNILGIDYDWFESQCKIGNDTTLPVLERVMVDFIALPTRLGIAYSHDYDVECHRSFANGHDRPGLSRTTVGSRRPPRKHSYSLHKSNPTHKPVPIDVEHVIRHDLSNTDLHCASTSERAIDSNVLLRTARDFKTLFGSGHCCSVKSTNETYGGRGCPHPGLAADDCETTTEDEHLTFFLFECACRDEKTRSAFSIGLSHIAGAIASFEPCYVWCTCNRNTTAPVRDYESDHEGERQSERMAATTEMKTLIDQNPTHTLPEVDGRLDAHVTMLLVRRDVLLELSGNRAGAIPKQYPPVISTLSRILIVESTEFSPCTQRGDECDQPCMKMLIANTDRERELRVTMPRAILSLERRVQTYRDTAKYNLYHEATCLTNDFLRRTHGCAVWKFKSIVSGRFGVPFVDVMAINDGGALKSTFSLQATYQSDDIKRDEQDMDLLCNSLPHSTPPVTSDDADMAIKTDLKRNWTLFVPSVSRREKKGIENVDLTISNARQTCIISIDSKRTWSFDTVPVLVRFRQADWIVNYEQHIKVWLNGLERAYLVRTVATDDLSNQIHVRIMSQRDKLPV